MTIYFTSDTHFDHEIMMSNKVGLKHRVKFDNVDKMNSKIIEIWNKTIKKDDVVYHLGDFSAGKLPQVREKFSKLNGTIRMIPGNHDWWIGELKKNLMMGKNPVTSNGKDVSILPPIHELIISNIDKVEYGFPKDHHHEDMFDLHLVLCHYPLQVWPRMKTTTLHLHGHMHGTLRKDPDNDCVSKYNRIDVGIDATNFKPVTLYEIYTSCKSAYYDVMTNKQIRDSSRDKSELRKRRREYNDIWYYDEI